jgi:hypothetical protein
MNLPTTRLLFRRTAKAEERQHEQRGLFYHRLNILRAATGCQVLVACWLVGVLVVGVLAGHWALGFGGIGRVAPSALRVPVELGALEEV